jgi:myo-inositol-1(or 4)-monophosphatase
MTTSPSPTAEWTRRLREAERIIRSATPLLLEGYSATPGADEPRRLALLGTEKKSTYKDLVTVFDRRVEEFLVRELERSFPGEAIIGEEGSSSLGESGSSRAQGLDAFWVIDPIDGTTNYSRAYPFFCSTLAFITREANHRAVPRVGVTWDPLHAELFSASEGGGSWLNRQALKVTSVGDPKQALLATGFAQSRVANSAPTNFERFGHITSQTLGVRRDGAAALDLAYVAAGRIDAYWEGTLAPWDVAAGMLLIREAGGLVTHFDGTPSDPLTGEVLSSNGHLHKWLLDTIKMV